MAYYGSGHHRILGRSDRDRGEAWSVVGFAGLILQNCTFLGLIAVRHALAATTADNSGATADNSGATAALWSLHHAILAPNGTFLALALVGLSLSGLRAALIRPRHAALGLISDLLLVTPAVLAPPAIDTDGPLGLVGLVGGLLWVVWLVTYGATLVRLRQEGERRAHLAARADDL